MQVYSALSPLLINLAEQRLTTTNATTIEVMPTPLEHLAAVLHSLDPVALDSGDLLSRFEEIFPVSELLSAPLYRVLTAEEGDEPLPDGEDPWNDAMLLRVPLELSEDSLIEGLYLPQPGDAVAVAVAAMEGVAASRATPNKPTRKSSARGWQHVGHHPSVEIVDCSAVAAAPTTSTTAPAAVVTFDGLPPKAVTADVGGIRCVPSLKLPAALRLASGRRHGQPGEAAGDAAREAYVRGAVQWLVAGRQVARLLQSTRQREALAKALEARGLRFVAAGRWATALGLITHPRLTVAALVARKAITEVQAEALVQIMGMCHVDANVKEHSRSQVRTSRPTGRSQPECGGGAGGGCGHDRDGGGARGRVAAQEVKGRQLLQHSASAAVGIVRNTDRSEDVPAVVRTSSSCPSQRTEDSVEAKVGYQQQIQQRLLQIPDLFNPEEALERVDAPLVLVRSGHTIQRL